jgi:cytochrome b6-f complex iron-sulfur subunit
MNRNHAIVMPATPLNAKHPLTRREFLNLLSKIFLTLSGILGLGGLLRFFIPPFEKSPKTVFDLGSADQFPLGTRTHLPEAQAVLIHTSTGYTVLSLLCPHLGCQVDDEEDHFTCPCHGSSFDDVGKLVRGPAKTSLNQLSLNTDDPDNFILYTN